jgi:hypothetical protein
MVNVEKSLLKGNCKQPSPCRAFQEHSALKKTGGITVVLGETFILMCISLVAQLRMACHCRCPDLSENCQLGFQFVSHVSTCLLLRLAFPSDKKELEIKDLLLLRI